MLRRDQERQRWWCINLSSIFMAENGSSGVQTKYVYTRYHFIREHVEDEFIEIKFVRAEENDANIFIKPAIRETYEQCG
jgi:hypothetical protein